MKIDALKKLIIGVLKKYPIKKAALFGSFARNEENNESDIDILIEANQPISLFDVLRIEKELGELTSRKIDIVEYSAIKSSIRSNILKDAITIL